MWIEGHGGSRRGQEGGWGGDRRRARGEGEDNACCFLRPDSFEEYQELWDGYNGHEHAFAFPPLLCSPMVTPIRSPRPFLPCTLHPAQHRHLGPGCGRAAPCVEGTTRRRHRSR